MFVILLKFNVFFLIGVAGQYMYAVYFASKDSPDLAERRPVSHFLWAGVLVIVVLCAYYLLGYSAVQTRSKARMFAFIAVMLTNLAAMGFILATSATNAVFTPTRIWLSGL
jgi:bacteriorhodopsin